MSAPTRVQHVTCLGCGCGCDDLTVTVSEGRIVDAAPVCPLGRAWLGDGTVPLEIRREGQPASLDDALREAATLLVGARRRCLVYLAPNLTSQAQRAALEIADLVGATVDSATSETASAGLLAAQRRGRATATLGEIRNRGDVLLFWAVDPAQRCPRFGSRYALEPVGTHVPRGRAGRYVISVSVGSSQGGIEADSRLTLKPEEEITALSLMRASVLGNPLPELSTQLAQAIDIASRLAAARYAILVHDADSTSDVNPLRVEALIALTQALNGPTRAALSSLRAGGNRSGAEAVLTSQTGYPFSVDYTRGYPRYLPGERGLDRLARGAFRVVLLAGSPELDGPRHAALSKITAIVVGPRASQAPFASRVAIDTGSAGVHEDGIAYRMDEVPMALRPPLPGSRSARETLEALADAIRGELRRAPR
jgi:formylmethanofuran dehydrogenase subunit B